MTINLSNLNSRNQQIDQARNAQQKARVNTGASQASTAQPTTSAKSDSVNITSQAKSLTAMERNLAQGTPVNEAKVERLKKTVADGSYQVDANKLAKNISNFESQLG